MIVEIAVAELTVCVVLFFFFSSRRRHTRWTGDWSLDVCSSDLRHPDSVLTLHAAEVAHPGLNLAGMAARMGISDAVRFPDTYSYQMALISREQQVAWYRGLDVLSNCSYGEGFGLAALEAQACGVPVILTNGSTGPELCGSGWLVSGTPDWAPGHGAEWVRPDITDIDAAYETAWQARENGTMPNGPARDFAEL